MPSNEFPPLLRIARGRKPFWKRVLLIGGAVLCFIAGIFGWLIPIVTGVPFYVAGLVLLGMASPRVLQWINRTEAKLSPTWRRRLRQGLKKIPFRKVREAVRS
jgi:hypothetical protein